MSAVVERCPNCGVEHDLSHTGPCEVCGSELRYWCQRHGRELGWLSGPECPQCLREAETRTAPAPPRPPVVHRPAERPPPPRVTVEPARRRERRPPPRLGAEDFLPHLATGASLAFRLVRAVVVLIRTVVLWALLGAAAGAGYAILMGGDVVWIGIFGLTNGAVLGLFLGFFLAVASLFRQRRLL